MTTTSRSQTLHTLHIGDAGPLVAFCHGVFGQAKNWTTVAKALAKPDDDGRSYQSLLIDMPNHGRSRWTDTLSYHAMADEIAEFLEPHAPLAVVGHSMGGKASMNLALRYPDLVTRLCVVDMSPVAYTGPRQFNHLVDAMTSLDLQNLPNRRTAEERMADQVPDVTVRQFLLQNLQRVRHHHNQPKWSWQPNLDLIAGDLDVLAGWEEPEGGRPFERPVLWIGGAKADYITTEYADTMRSYFPRAHLMMLKGIGHWVHSEAPEIFVPALRHFLDKEPTNGVLVHKHQ